ncbi:hypothetical protein [Paenarthrobacter sp. TA1.8]|uniref:hypothetical protein n=1 Tax=Paenarthrobacter sp. TA1.8 TaxID=3400219 RepID=UPI003B43B792
MGSRVIHSDLEEFLTGFIRRELEAIGSPLASDVFVSNEFPNPARPKSVIVRDDGGPDASIITAEPTVGVTVLTDEDPTEGETATNLALLVKAIVKGCARVEPGNPVAAVLGFNGPYKVPDETGCPRRYMTAELSVAGKAFP